MDESRTNKFTIIVIIALVILGGVGLYLLNERTDTGETSQDTASVIPDQYILAGKITSIDVEAETFVFEESRMKQAFTVVIGNQTSLIQTIFPDEITEDFQPIRNDITMLDLSVGDQISVRSAQPVSLSKGITIESPKEVQILP